MLSPESRAIEIRRRVPVKWEKREDIYPMLARGVGVEIGVRRGLNAAKLLKIAKPEKLYLVDPWRGELRHWRTTRKEQKVWDGNYKRTCKLFAGNKRVEIVRFPGDEAKDMFPLESLSWVYVDGNHMFAHAFMDMYYFYRRVKVGGYMMAHDFCLEVSNGAVIWAFDLMMKMFGQSITVIGRSNETCPTVVMKIGKKIDPAYW